MRGFVSRLWLLAIVLILLGCNRLPDPEKVGARRLPETADLRNRFSVSPQGSWLLYSRRVDTTGAVSFALIRLEDEKRFSVEIDESARDALEPLNWVLNFETCWDREERAVTFMYDQCLEGGGPVEIRLDRPPYRLAEAENPDAWDLVEPPLIELGFPAAGYGYELVDVENTRHRIVLSMDGRTLADHRQSGLIRLQLILEVVAPSPDGRFLAYAYQRSHFLNAGKPGFIVPTDGSFEPLALGSVVRSPIVWDPVRPRLYASAIMRGGRGIYVWQLDELFPEVDW